MISSSFKRSTFPAMSKKPPQGIDASLQISEFRFKAGWFKKCWHTAMVAEMVGNSSGDTSFCHPLSAICIQLSADCISCRAWQQQTALAIT